MADIQLFYFDVRARGEPIRLLLHAARQTFDDVRIPRASWGQEDKAGFYGKTEEDGLRVDEVVHLFHDLRPHLRTWFRENDEQKKAEYAQKMKDETFPRYLGYFEALLVDNGGTGFFVGDSVSLADIMIYDALDTVLGVVPEAVDAFPCLQKLRRNVEALPALKEYLATRPKSTF